MGKLQAPSIKGKLITIIMGITLTALLVTNISQTAIDYFHLRTELTNELNKEAELSGKNLASALDFLDQKNRTRSAGQLYSPTFNPACLSI